MNKLFFEKFSNIFSILFFYNFFRLKIVWNVCYHQTYAPPKKKLEKKFEKKCSNIFEQKKIFSKFWVMVIFWSFWWISMNFHDNSENKNGKKLYFIFHSIQHIAQCASSLGNTRCFIYLYKTRFTLFWMNLIFQHHHNVYPSQFYELW